MGEKCIPCVFLLLSTIKKSLKLYFHRERRKYLNELMATTFPNFYTRTSLNIASILCEKVTGFQPALLIVFSQNVNVYR